LQRKIARQCGSTELFAKVRQALSDYVVELGRSLAESSAHFRYLFLDHCRSLSEAVKLHDYFLYPYFTHDKAPWLVTRTLEKNHLATPLPKGTRNSDHAAPEACYSSSVAFLTARLSMDL